MQEIKSEVQHNDAIDTDRPESITNSSRHSSQRYSFLQSISRVSGVGNSSRHSFSYGLPTTVGLFETTTGEPEVPLAAASKPPLEVPIHRLAYLNKPEIPVLLIGTIAAVANGAIFPIFGLLLSKMVNTFYEPADELHKDAKLWALIFVALGLSSFLISPAKSYFFAIAGEKLIKRMRVMCFEKIIHMEVGWFDEAEHSSAALGSRLSTDAASIRALVGDALGLLVQNVASAVVGLVIAFEANWQLALIILVLLPLLALNGYLQLKFIQGFSADAKVCSQLLPLNRV